ncbi:toxin-antitoxin system HicB family antitoxin [Leptospira sp. GIMC2001]|uniref:toxin-antitoxin system HicB family antitoxin n=1 Tax=Leptospira sp. GIMC2001 TaxID=1513297 RepID=UPI0023498B6B|nr:toxin-antitoxin system HicB family antitoxin [Leptospira sp. GIMC2001]WCL50775.1 toxin-antitoxin system HicB family antitoxin [Leptospira sp. GIMC2001]
MSKKNVLTIRVPEDLKYRIEKTASLQGVSINQFALYAFTKGISEIDTDNFFRSRIEGKKSEKIEKDFFEIWNRAGNKKTKLPEWDKI